MTTDWIPANASLLFFAADLRRENQAMLTLSESFINENTNFMLHEFARQVDYVARNETSNHDLTVSTDRDTPLLTRLSHGEYELGRRGGKPIRGRITGNWTISGLKLDARAARELKSEIGKVSHGTEVVAFTGVGSFKTVLEDDSKNEMSAWDMDIGAAGSPGAFFHTYAKRKQESGGLVVPVPRHPNFFPSPMACLEFVLSELFQDRWRRVVSESDAVTWRALQRTRFEALNDWWSRAALNDGSEYSPWTYLSRAKPDPLLFLRAAKPTAPT